ncbi:hypothetical protein C8R45DRAFT_1182967 [Mycena sanguinolenta]|nr:hypothetical protein C8R45DRAFT_1182967 [Mycena sanguinolenta]
MTSIRLAALLAFFTVGTLAQPITTTVATQTSAPNEVLYITTACSPTCPATDTSGNALIETFSCGATCLFCRWNWVRPLARVSANGAHYFLIQPGGNHFAEYDTTGGAVSWPVGVVANPSLAPVTCATSTSTSTIYPSRTTQVATSTPTPGEIVSTTTTCSSICPPSDNSGNALIESTNCGTNCLFCRWNWDTGAIYSPIGVAANPTIAAVACTTSAATSFLPTPSSSSLSSTTTPVQSSSTTSSATSFLPTPSPSSLSSTTTPVQSSTSSVCRTNPVVCARP